jgi:hypothetical protein
MPLLQMGDRNRRFPLRHLTQRPNSGSREVAWQFALELGKVTGDHGDVETPQDRLLGLAIKQELERCLDATFGRMRAHRQSLASLSCHRDVMTSLAVSTADGDLELKWIGFAGSFDLDHSLPTRNRLNLVGVPDRA